MAITCLKLTIETVEQGVKYVQSKNKNTRTTPTTPASQSYLQRCLLCPKMEFRLGRKKQYLSDKVAILRFQLITFDHYMLADSSNS